VAARGRVGQAREIHVFNLVAPMVESAMEPSMKLRVVIEQDEDGVFIAQCPALPGCVSQGATRAEALANIRDAMAGYVESLRKHGEPIPPSIDEEVVEIGM
jgi:predicted RNase H-like HicB family nuclease